jgi:hypothetical protein
VAGLSREAAEKAFDDFVAAKEKAAVERYRKEA